MTRLLLFFLVFTLRIQPVFSAELTLNDVLESVRERFPLILGLEQEIIAAEGQQRTALGEFDLSWKTKANIVGPGYYQTQRFQSILEKPTSIWGLNVYGGYRQGDGKFAVYDGRYETTPAGEFHAGFGLPLLRDREIDQRRASLKSSELGLELASQQVEQKKIEFVFIATEKYWSWVAYGLREKIAQDLLAIAKDRVSGLKDRVDHGDAALIELKDNQRTVLQREAQLVKAQRAFQNGSIELSLYMRDRDGRPIIPKIETLPKQIIRPTKSNRQLDKFLKEALDNRPEIKALKLEKSQFELENKLAQNSLDPKFDLFMEVSNDIGDGDNTKEPTELESGVLLEIPLQRRKAEGMVITNTAKISKINQQLEFITNKIKADVQDALSALENAQLQIEIIREELKYAKEVEEGERDRFKAGESTILFVNIRELTTADTAGKEVEALAEYRVAEGMLKAALGVAW